MKKNVAEQNNFLCTRKVFNPKIIKTLIPETENKDIN